MSTPRLRACLTAAAAAALLSGCAREERTAPLGFEQEANVSLLEGLLLYVAVPLAILLVVAGLVWLPGMVRSSRYRPGRGWSAAPLWFGGPPDPAAAVERADTGDMVRGGASGDW